jgi:SAM-dependent methyltransferase
MRFDSTEHLEVWRRTGRFPAIHDSIFSAIENFMRGSRVLDLCCSTGLLAQRLAKLLKVTAVGVDADARALERAWEAGVDVPLVEMKINDETMSELASVIRAHRIDVLVARRAMPELFGDNLPLGHQFSAMLYDLNVREIFLEGRVATRNAVNPLASIDKEVELFGGHYVLARSIRSVAYLKRIE